MALIVIALMALLGASLYYAYGIWTTLGAADLPGWMYAAMIGGVVFSLLVGGGLMGLVFYSAAPATTTAPPTTTSEPV